MSATANTITENIRTATRARIKRGSAIARREMNRLDAQVIDQLTSVYQRAVDELQTAIRSYAGIDGNIKLASMQQLLTQSQQILGQLNIARDQLLTGGLTSAAELGASAYSGAMEGQFLTRSALEAVTFVQHFVGADGLQLSDRIWRLNNHASQMVSDAISNAVVQGHSASQATNDFLSRGEPVPAEVAGKLNAARADTLARTVGRDLMNTGSPRYNAMRVFRTEINRAHGEAYMSTGSDHPDFAGWRFLLSPAHPEPDICDMHARANVHGLGPGVYPSRERCPWPAHPNTLSYVEIVFKDEITEGDSAGQQNRLDWLKTQPGSIQESVLNSRKKRAALNIGLLKENEINTPWQVLKEKYQRKGVDLEKLVLPPPPPVTQTGATIVTGMERGAFESYADDAFRYAPAEVNQLIKNLRKPATIEIVPKGSSWYTGDRLHLAQTSMKSRSGFHSMHDVYRHEYGHFVDYWLYSENGRITLPASSLPGSQGGLKTAIDAARKQLRSRAAGAVEKQQQINDFLRNQMDMNLADLFGALTKNRLGWGHSARYLSRPGFSETEVFANLFDIYSRNDRGAWNFVSTELPDLAEDFTNLIQSEAAR
jgi:hypothetical protein